VGRLWYLAVLLSGCGGHALSSESASGGGGSASGGSAVDAGGGATALPGNLAPRSDAPNAEGDGILPDLPDARVGDPGNGWDLCLNTPSWRRYESIPCNHCPAAQRGDDYLIIGPHTGEGTAASGTSLPQAYFYFHPPISAAALWLDIAYFEGERTGWLELLPTTLYCEPTGEPRHFELRQMLEGPTGKWSSTCVPLTDFGLLDGLGFSLGSEGGVFAVDALRFGPACPP